MAKPSKKQLTIDGILACGYVEEVGRSRKFRCFNKPAPEGVPTRTLLVGKAGALRSISESCSSLAESRSITGTRLHAAYAYVGNLIPNCVLTADQSRKVVVDHTKGLIT
jgi:hypothetical protein